MAIDFTKTKKVREKREEKPALVAVVTPSLDITKAVFARYEAEIKFMQAKAGELRVESDASVKDAINLAGQAKKIVNAIEKQRKEVIAAPSDYVKAINSFCKLFTEPLAQVENGLKLKISQYEAKRELERREAEERARREAEALQRKINEEAQKLGVEAPQVPELVMPKAETVTRTESGVSSFQKKIWDFELIDIKLVPREYLTLDALSVRNALRMGIREIPGLRIFEKTTTVLKSS